MTMVQHEEVVEAVGCGITLFREYKYGAAFDALIEWRDDPVAALFLGWMIHKGEGFIVRDWDKSTELFNLAFDNVAAIRRRGHSDPRIFTMLGKAHLYACGRFPRDNNAAFDLFSVASQSSDAGGMYWLGRCCRHGWGVNVDEARAMDLMRSAAELGNAKAFYEMQDHYHNVSKEISFIYSCLSSISGYFLGS